MYVADIDGRLHQQRMASQRRLLRFAAITAGILLGIGAAAIAWVMGRAI